LQPASSAWSTAIVVAKSCSQALPLDRDSDLRTMAMFDSIRGRLRQSE
jgi:hypothetical protein